MKLGLALLALAGLPLCAAPPLRVLILTGANNHDWRATTPVLRDALERTGRFTVEVETNVPALPPEAFARYDVLLSNFNTFGAKNQSGDWRPETRAAFLAFVRGGKGFVTVHAGSSSYYDWPEYHQIAGATWKLGQTSHNAPHTFTVTASAARHPVTEGLAPFTTTDELWLKPGVDPAATVLAEADGQPVALATAFGQGRGFALMLGHNPQFMANAGFQALLVRGTEWAATGQATIDPADGLLKSVAAYTYGQGRAPLLDVARAAQHAPRTWAPKLAALLAGEATLDAKNFACDQLSLVGTEAEVPALARLLGDTNLAFSARFALERIPGEAALSALREALPAATGEARAGLMLALGARGDAKSVPALAQSLPDPAAIDALGLIGSAEALRALAGAEKLVPAGDRLRWSQALLRCAERQRDADTLAQLTTAGHAESVRIAAFAASAGGEAVLAALSGTDFVLQDAALAALRGNKDPKLIGQVAGRLDTLSPPLQAQVLTLCAARGAREALPAATKAVAGGDASLRLVALEALAVLGDAASAPAVVAALERASDAAVRKAAVDGLARLRGTGVEEAILDALASASPATRADLLKALVARESRTAVPVLVKAAADGDAAVRREAIRGLGLLAEAGAGADLLSLLDQPADADRAALETALAAIYRRAGSVAAVVKAAGAASGAKKASLAAVLGAVGGPEALAALRALLRNAAPEAQLAAVRALANWADAAPLEDLVAAAESSQDVKIDALALRGVARLAPLATDRKVADVTALLKRGVAAAGREEEAALLNGLLAGLSAVNLARGATATNLDGLAPDHAGRGPEAAIDGDPATYWDETDHKDLYWIKVALKRPAKVVRLRITGFQHQQYAPKDFDVLYDGRVVKSVVNLVYAENVAIVDLPATTCSTVELKITGRYGPSPAIRELEILGEEGGP